VLIYCKNNFEITMFATVTQTLLFAFKNYMEAKYERLV